MPPWNDGSKNVVRDLARALTQVTPTVLVTPGASSIAAHVCGEPVYRTAGGFSPAVLDNVRVLMRLLTGDPHDVWHFVFAPNFASSAAGRVARTLRASLGWNGRVVQTVASAPKTFEHLGSLLFGDLIVAQSAFTKARLVAAGADSGRIFVIPPCAAAPCPPTEVERRELRERYRLGSGPLFVYAGDYEVSGGAETVADAALTIVRAAPEARIVFACRPKTPRAEEAKRKLIARLKPLEHAVAHVGVLPSLAPLVAEARALLFPVDNLYGKVDLPLVLLEALALGTPLVLVRGGPLEEITAARFVAPGDAAGVAREALALLDDERHAELVLHGRAVYDERYTPATAAAAYESLYLRCTP